MSESIAPLPDNGDYRQDMQNAWRILMESVPIDAEQKHYIPTTSELPPAIRSNVRTGELFLNKEGMTIHGWMRRADKTYYLVKFIWLLLIMASIVGMLFATNLSDIWKAVFGTTPVLLAILLFMYSNNVERRCQEASETIFWKDVIGAQIDNRLRWVSLLYTTPSERTGQVLPHFFTLNGLPPATVLNVAETISHFAPHAKCVRLPGWEWTRKRKIIYGCFAVLALLMLGMAILRL